MGEKPYSLEIAKTMAHSIAAEDVAVNPDGIARRPGKA